MSVEDDMHSWFLLLCFVVLVNVTSWGIPPNIHEGSIWAGVELITHGRNTKRRQTGWVYCENKQDILTEPAHKVLKSARKVLGRLAPFVNLLMIPMNDEKIGHKSNHVSPVDCSVL